jgi:hypothetical protein
MSAMAKKREKLQFKFLSHILYTGSRFGCEEERSWPATIEMNENGGMKDVEFKMYIEKSICPFYPDMDDAPGKHILLKVNSGPGRKGKKLLMKCQFHRLCIYPSLPNATSVQQEMHIYYGPFKSIVHCNLKRIASAFYTAGDIIPLGVSTVGLIIYGGTILVGRTDIMCRNACRTIQCAIKSSFLEQGWSNAPHQKVPQKTEGSS